jgi:hypothetical protein
LLARPERDSPMRAIVLRLGRIELKHIAPSGREDRPPYACVKLPGPAFCVHLVQPWLSVPDGTATLACSVRRGMFRSAMIPISDSWSGLERR